MKRLKIFTKVCPKNSREDSNWTHTIFRNNSFTITERMWNSNSEGDLTEKKKLLRCYNEYGQKISTGISTSLFRNNSTL